MSLIEAIHAITLEAQPHRGCGCQLCRIQHLCEGGTITPDPAKLLPERLCYWRKKEESLAEIIDRLEATGGHNKPCHSCGTLCNGLAGNPGLWPICLPVDGQPTWFCTACIASMRDEAAKENSKCVNPSKSSEKTNP